MAKSDPVVTFDDVTVACVAQAALQDVRTAFASRAIGLLRPNGAGKSTMITALLGLIAPARGRMRVLGHDVAAAPLQIRARVGHMPESDAHIPGMNAVSFVAYCGELSGLPRVNAFRHQRAHADVLGDSVPVSLTSLAVIALASLWLAGRAVERREYVLEQ